MLHVGCGIAPADAHPVALRAARIVLSGAAAKGACENLSIW